jgi:two-component system alkaline phosphatase synthesis response regulator PhoP
MTPRPADKGHVVLIEDEKNIAELVRYNLEEDGYRVSVAADGEQGLRMVERQRPDLVLLDLLLPRLDGLEVCRQLKRNTDSRAIPIIMLTAKAGEADKVAGLELGADDYITKPFSPRELVARIRAALRRQAPAEPARALQCGSLSVDWERHQVRVGGQPVKLTAKEMRLFRVLVEAGGRVLSRDALLDRVWGYDPALEIETRTVDFHISQLRRKLRKEGRRIATIAGSGYRFLMEPS